MAARAPQPAVTIAALTALPPWSSGPAHVRHTMRQCLVLAALLHLLAVVVVGTSPGGRARAGEGVYGRLSVRLAGHLDRHQQDATVAADAHSGPEGQAQRQRYGGSVRDRDDDARRDRGGGRRIGRAEVVGDRKSVV